MKSYYNKVSEKSNVTISNGYQMRVKCNCCGQEWFPNVQCGGKYPRGFYKCPHGCSEKCSDCKCK